MTQFTYIYALIDPRPGNIKLYIGKTDYPEIRYKTHFNRMKEVSTPKNSWLIKLNSLGLKPIMEILDEIPKKEWQFWERHYISLYKSWGFNLLNQTVGGEGTDGHKHTDQSKIKIGLAGLKRNVSQKTREILRLKNTGKTHRKETIDLLKMSAFLRDKKQNSTSRYRGVYYYKYRKIYGKHLWTYEVWRTVVNKENGKNEYREYPHTPCGELLAALMRDKRVQELKTPAKLNFELCKQV